MEATEALTPLQHFPLENPRPAQTEALNFLWESMIAGYEDIVISAPTGCGKSHIGSALCFWASTIAVPSYVSGGYYLVTQKMLQDQLEKDFPRFASSFTGKAASIRSAVEYHCPKYGSCGMGAKMRGEKKCAKRSPHARSCPYLLQKHRFENAQLAVTNYPYFFTARTFSEGVPPRIALVADEAHTLDKQITGFVEICVGKESLESWAPHLKPLPDLPGIDQFCFWLKNTYLSALVDRLQMLEANLDACNFQNTRLLDEFNKLENHISRVNLVQEELQKEPDNWVYWQEEVNGERQSTAKPISSVSFFPDLIQAGAATRVYMSAYLGPKPVFCRSLGLDAEKTAWLELDCAFPVENRPVHIFQLGSMGRKGFARTFPGLCSISSQILDLHKDTKGLIHCASYALGKQLYDYFSHTKHSRRIIFPLKAADRKVCLERHMRSPEPTVMLSPSIGEGYSFDDELARFQILVKCPYPSLGDRQVLARKNQDPAWYTLQTAMNVIQSVGRIVRGPTDFGTSYVLDSDFARLLDENPQFFPDWFTKALQFVS